VLVFSPHWIYDDRVYTIQILLKDTVTDTRSSSFPLTEREYVLWSTRTTSASWLADASVATEPMATLTLIKAHTSNHVSPLLSDQSSKSLKPNHVATAVSA
jgi:hypothetical protein